MSLKKQALSAARWTTLAMVGKAGLQFVQLAVLARFLAPGDFGLMALVGAVILFTQIFSDAGVSNAIIHRQDISRSQLAGLYWLNVGVSSALMLGLILASPLLASLYHEPRLQNLLIWVSTTLLINAISQQWRILAEKELLFDKLARIELGAAGLGFTTACLMAINGAGVYSLVAGALVSSLTQTALAWLLLKPEWLPLQHSKWAEIRSFVGFGAYMVGNNLLNTFTTQADILLGGRLLGSASLGQYSVPRELSLRLGNLLNPIVTRVGFPVMSKAQGDQAQLQRVYLKTLRMTASVNFPLYLAMSLFAPEIVALLLGPSWVQSADLLRILALWGMVRATANPSGSLIFAVGRADLAFKWNLGLAFAMTPALWFGSHYGNTGLALALLLSQTLLIIPAWAILIRPLCGAGFAAYHAQLLVPLVLGLAATTAAWLAALPLENTIARLAAGLSVGLISYIGLSRQFNREWFATVLELVSKSHKSNTPP